MIMIMMIMVMNTGLDGNGYLYTEMLAGSAIKHVIYAQHEMSFIVNRH